MTRIMRIDEFAAQMVNEMAVRPDVFKDYDEVDIFDSTYFIVKNGNGLYNLIDRNGNLISDIWFEKITKNDDGSVDTVVKDNGNKSHAVTYSDPKEFEDCIEVQKDLLDGIILPVDIDFDDIIPVTPYPIKTDTKNTVTIIAKVMLDRKELLLGKDGKLYNADGSEYSQKQENGVIKNNKKLTVDIINELENKYSLTFNKKTGLWDCGFDIICEGISDLVSEDGELILSFGEVTGDFILCEGNLTSLKGSPKKVGGSFDCSSNLLISLEGAPQEVGGSFDCSHNQLTSLEGAPQEVDGFLCNDNRLTSLKGSPQKVKNRFDCSYNRLTSLKGAPQEVGGRFDCYHNPLSSLKGLPKKIGGDIGCDYDENKKWSIAQQICNLAIINDDLFDRDIENLKSYKIYIDYKIPERFGSYDGSTKLEVFPYVDDIRDNGISVYGEYTYDDGTYDDEEFPFYLFNKKEQKDILNALLKKIKEKK